jgi:hypothetical protein
MGHHILVDWGVFSVYKNALGVLHPMGLLPFSPPARVLSGFGHYRGPVELLRQAGLVELFAL